jgi:molecular chaperone GrpE
MAKEKKSKPDEILEQAPNEKEESIPETEETLEETKSSLEEEVQASENEYSEDQELETLDPKDQEIASLHERVTKLEEQLLREQAEMINFKRRMTDEKIKDRQFANQRILKDLLPLIDHLEMMLKNEKENESFKAFEKTFNSLYENFLSVLSSHDCLPVNALHQPFDPALHEAVMKEPSEAFENGTVIEEFQKGYTYKERLLRPSMVKVSE